MIHETQVSETELLLAKQQMDREFQRNQIKPGDPRYEYDKQVGGCWRLYCGGGRLGISGSVCCLLPDLQGAWDGGFAPRSSLGPRDLSH